MRKKDKNHLQNKQTLHLCHLFPVRLCGHRWFRQEDWLLFGADLELGIEDVPPHPLHLVPVGYDTAIDGVDELTDEPSMDMSIIADVSLFKV